MKKNFLMVAALLIAAMLMVVSCTQEVAPKNELVEVKLGVGYGRDLTVSGDTKTKDMVLKYTMEYAWNNPTGTEEEIVGAQGTPKDFNDGDSIGYVTPGLWTVHVYAYEKLESGAVGDKPIFDGQAQAYFSDKNNKVTVYLAPTSGQTNTIRFAVSMQDLVGDVEGAYKGDGSYVLKYSLQRTSENYAETTDVVINKVSVDNSLPTDIRFEGTLNNSSVYYAKADNLASGYYRATVKVYSIKEDGSPEKLVGGISKGFLLSGGNTATLKGHIEPSEYINFVIDAVLVNVNTALSVEGTKENVTVDYNPAGTSVDVKWTDSTGDVDNLKEKNTYWSLNGGKFEQVAAGKDVKELSKSYPITAPGYNYVTVTTVYKVEAPTTGDAAADYFYADTQTIRIFVNPETSSSNL